jgi:hypothetical protein
MSNGLKRVSGRRAHVTSLLPLALALSLGQPASVSFGQSDIHISQQPASQTVIAGTNVTFQVTATGGSPLSYQWVQANGDYWTWLSGEHGSSLTLTNVQLSDAYDYFVQISDATSYADSDEALLTVEQAPQFTLSPGDETVVAGTNVTLSVWATANPPASYQWQFNGVDIAGATNWNLILTNVQSTNQGSYTAVASNFLGAVTNVPAQLTVTDSAPFLSPDLSDRVAIANTSVTLGGTIYGTGPMIYQWRKNGTNVPAATNATLVFGSIQLSDAGTFSVSASNALGHVTSRVAKMTVENYPLPSTIVAWGDNTYGQINLPTGETNVVALTAGGYGTIFLRQDGTMGGFGSPPVSPPTFALLPRVATVTSYGSYALALGQDGTPVSFGVTYYSGASDVPPTVTNCIAVAAGNPRLAVFSDGTVVGWNPRPSFEVPDPGKILPSLPGLSGVRNLAINNFHCLVLESNATVVGLGANGSGQSTVPPGLNGVVAVATGAYHSLALKSNGTVVAWGDNSRGQTNVPPGLSGVMAISAGDYHNLALQSNGMVVAWGDNSSGQCNIPAGLSNVVYVSAAGAYSTVLTKQPGEVVAPQSQIVNAGANVTFSSLASGYQPLSYQWQFNGTNIPGATNASLMMTNVPLTSAGTYRCVASNGFGVVAGTAAGLTVLRQTPQFSGLLQFTNGGFGLQLNLLSGHGNVILEASTNLVDWQAIYTNPPVIGSFQYFDLNATSLPARFYRAFEQ